MSDLRQLERAIWRISDGRGSADDLSLFEADEDASLAILDRLIIAAEDDLDSVRNLSGDERDQVVNDFIETLAGLRSAAARLRPPPPAPEPFIGFDDFDVFEAPVDLGPDEVLLQASWSAGEVVVWAAGRRGAAETNEQLATRIETVGGPPQGWQVHTGVELPDGRTAEALTIPVEAALGWLAVMGSAPTTDGVGHSLTWMGRVAIEGVRLVAHGAIVPTVHTITQRRGRPPKTVVRWMPAYPDGTIVDVLGATMPRTVSVLTGGTGNATATAVLTAVVQAIVAEGVERIELPTAPPAINTPTDMADTVVAHLDGTSFFAPPEVAKDLSRRVENWSRTVTDPSHPRLIVRLEPPTSQGVWLVSVQARVGRGKLLPIESALRAGDAHKGTASELARLERVFPAFDRARSARRGQVALSQDEAWKFMTSVGPTLASIGFEVRAPELSRRRATASLRLFAEAPEGSKVGAQQLSNVAWTVLFDDVELTAEDIARLARQARPLVQSSNGNWVEVDRLDLERAAEVLAERASVRQLTGAEILRQSLGLDGSGLSGGVVVQGSSWAKDIIERASAASLTLVTSPDGFDGELRSYQAEALSWIGFLEAAELGGCLALDMGLGKTPTVLAHLARNAGDGITLVVAPAAVVGNWAREAERFAPKLRVVVHHGIDRASASALAEEIADADIVITTYATAVRDVDALATVSWARMVLDEAQAIKNPTSDTALQLRRLNARTKIALTGTPIENGVGDLWAILDFTNPGLVGPRPTFVAQMSGDGESAMRALNGILLFRRTKAEPEVAAELPDKIDELDHCTMTPEQIGLYQAVLDQLLLDVSSADGEVKQGAILAAITALKQICNHPSAYIDDGLPLAGRSGKLARLEEIVESVFAADERVLVFTHFASWGRRLAEHLTAVTGKRIACYDGSLSRPVRDKLVHDFQQGTGAGAMLLSLKAGGTGLNLTSANHVVLYDRWWNPAVEDQARDRAWRIGQSRTVISHRLVCPGTVDERVEEVVAGKRHIASLVLPRSSSISDLNSEQLRIALGLQVDHVLTGDEL
jgi:superfamily II DNA or RNA helicase